jgi:hypothetical protein
MGEDEREEDEAGAGAEEGPDRAGLRTSGSPKLLAIFWYRRQLAIASATTVDP